jgi:cytochrome c-type biogenesis protein CcmH
VALWRFGRRRPAVSAAAATGAHLTPEEESRLAALMSEEAPEERRT